MKAISAIFVCALVAIPLGARASGPQPPCGAAASPVFAAPGSPPAIAVFDTAHLQQIGWQPPACTGWPAASGSKLVVAVAGSVRLDGSIDQLLARISAISTLRDVQYWSTTDQMWRPLAYDAAALTDADAKDRRRDFSPAELAKGAQLYYWENDSRSGEIVNRLNVREHSADRAVIASENITPVSRFLVTLFTPGTLQSVLFVQRLSPGVWGVYLLSRTGEGASILAGGHDASYVNRAVALYRQLAGIRTNEEPPPVR